MITQTVIEEEVRDPDPARPFIIAGPREPHRMLGSDAFRNLAAVEQTPALVMANEGLRAGRTKCAARRAALTLPAPAVDGQKLVIWDETGHAHTITVAGGAKTSPPSAGLNGGTTNNLLTFGGTVGQSVELTSRNGNWWTTANNGVTVS